MKRFDPDLAWIDPFTPLPRMVEKESGEYYFTKEVDKQIQELKEALVLCQRVIDSELINNSKAKLTQESMIAIMQSRYALGNKY